VEVLATEEPPADAVVNGVHVPTEAPAATADGGPTKAAPPLPTSSPLSYRVQVLGMGRRPGPLAVGATCDVQHDQLAYVCTGIGGIAHDSRPAAYPGAHVMLSHVNQSSGTFVHRRRARATLAVLGWSRYGTANAVASLCTHRLDGKGPPTPSPARNLCGPSTSCQRTCRRIYASYASASLSAAIRCVAENPSSLPLADGPVRHDARSC
jgi:hypothetical protein